MFGPFGTLVLLPGLFSSGLSLGPSKPALKVPACPPGRPRLQRALCSEDPALATQSLGSEGRKLAPGPCCQLELVLSLAVY